MEVDAPPSSFTPISSSPSTTTTMNSEYIQPQSFQPINSSPLPPTPTREFWSEAEKYDLLWSIILSTGLSVSNIPWEKVAIPSHHSQSSAAVVVQDIALGKHHITHPTFTPSNVNRNSSSKTYKSPGERKTKKRKLDSPEPSNTVLTNTETSAPPSTSPESHTSPISPSPEISTSPNTTDNTGEKKKKRRTRSESPIDLDLSNPHITQFLKREGYMNEDGSPVKKKRGRPTKDPFGLSVTLKKQLIRMDPNAPPMKKRGRPRKRFLEIGSGNLGGGGGENDGGKENVEEEESLSPGLREAIERIGEEMDREVESLLNEGRETEEEGWDETEEESITESREDDLPSKEGERVKPGIVKEGRITVDALVEKEPEVVWFGSPA